MTQKHTQGVGKFQQHFSAKHVTCHKCQKKDISRKCVEQGTAEKNSEQAFLSAEESS